MTTNRTRRSFLGSVGALGATGLGGCISAPDRETPSAEPNERRDRVFQVSTLDALTAGAFDGVLSIGELLSRGGFGVGTLEGVDGEMIVLDGTAYVVRPGGGASRVPDDETTPFAVVTEFEADRTVGVDGTIGYEALEERLDAELPTVNTFYAVRIEGSFESLLARSVPEQEPPYPGLEDVVAAETTFELEDVSGTLVGFRSPPYVDGVSVPGYHFHFVTDDRTAGGHVYEFEITDPTVEVDVSSAFSMVLPEGGRFFEYRSNQSHDTDDEAVTDG